MSEFKTAEEKQLPCRIPLRAGNSEVILDVHPGAESDLVFEYWGFPESLVTCGAASPEMVAPGPRGKCRVDSRGDRFHRLPRGQRMSIRRHVSFEHAAALPGYDAWMVGAAKRLLQELEVEEAERKAESGYAWTNISRWLEKPTAIAQRMLIQWQEDCPDARLSLDDARRLKSMLEHFDAQFAEAVRRIRRPDLSAVVRCDLL